MTESHHASDIESEASDLSVEDAKNDDHIEEILPVGYLEITLNYPRTATFLKMNSAKQRMLYIKIWMILRGSVDFPLAGMEHAHSDFQFEYCKSGQVHLHGYLPIYKKKYFIEGIISDLVKLYLEGMPKRYSKFSESFMFPELHRYRSPSICVQHDNLQLNGEVERMERWKTYITKCKTNN